MIGPSDKRLYSVARPRRFSTIDGDGRVATLWCGSKCKGAPSIRRHRSLAVGSGKSGVANSAILA